ncbi:15-hydroxyprostaglandin dehydrogenase [NAD(+)]-like [Osmia lignaria lignaria]|uniref:15-hydroxyprostaglandin dehydrogenase [NAD(+)]-like n=1 Tax=Osmia lignaria lignaria TaxID=1437193 RepID=UPI0014783949|nr:15-hydroxyprostaglandin dehydrogenase [NAD(+)]-like [Osmia lignaria]
MMENIKDKTVLVTGGASGIGFQYAKKLLANGAKVVAILDLSTSPGQTSVANLGKEFGKDKAVFFPCDVTDTVKFEETFKNVWNTLNGLDIVINNAGTLNDKDWQLTIKLNVGGVIQGSFLAIDYMGKHKGGKGGTIVNIASVVALTTYPAVQVYCASKHNVMAFSRCLQNYYEKTGVRVLTMCPGLTDTPLVATVGKMVRDFVDPNEVQKLINSLPMQPTENVANAMVLLIQKGKNGEIWVSECNQKPYAVEFPDVRKIELDV